MKKVKFRQDYEILTCPEMGLQSSKPKTGLK